MVLTLFNLENSRSFRVHWLINELQAPVEVRHYARVEGKKAVPEMARDSGFKLGKSPVLVEDGTGTGGGSGKYTVSESGNCLMCVDAACGWAAEAVDCSRVANSRLVPLHDYGPHAFATGTLLSAFD